MPRTARRAHLGQEERGYTYAPLSETCSLGARGEGLHVCPAQRDVLTWGKRRGVTRMPRTARRAHLGQEERGDTYAPLSETCSLGARGEGLHVCPAQRDVLTWGKRRGVTRMPRTARRAHLGQEERGYTYAPHSETCSLGARGEGLHVCPAQRDVLTWGKRRGVTRMPRSARRAHLGQEERGYTYAPLSETCSLGARGEGLHVCPAQRDVLTWGKRRGVTRMPRSARRAHLGQEERGYTDVCGGDTVIECTVHLPASQGGGRQGVGLSVRSKFWCVCVCVVAVVVVFVVVVFIAVLFFVFLLLFFLGVGGWGGGGVCAEEVLVCVCVCVCV